MNFSASDVLHLHQSRLSLSDLTTQSEVACEATPPPDRALVSSSSDAGDFPIVGSAGQFSFAEVEWRCGSQQGVKVAKSGPRCSARSI